MLCVFTAAFFVFFTASAGAGVVSSDFGLFELNLLYLDLALGGLRCGALSLGHCELADLIVAGAAYVPDVSGAGAGFEADAEDDVADAVLY